VERILIQTNLDAKSKTDFEKLGYQKVEEKFDEDYSLEAIVE